MSVLPDIDPGETQEWLEAFESVLEYEGPERAHYLLEKLIDKARRSGVYFPHSANTAYINTIPPALEKRSPGNHELEHRIRSYVRWNALAMKYLKDRELLDTQGRKVWAFMGDGEMDEPESLGSISLASREKLDNLIFVVNCNLQRLDGPVRGNGKIIQELEAVFRGAGWHVIKVIWGSYWDPLLA
ncbi:MAG: hypothetical protein ACREXU_18235, partial [Gammaproteobacteria bacterium]